MNINRQSNHRFCETCDEQLTWFTYHTLYHDNAYHMYCLKCYYEAVVDLEHKKSQCADTRSWYTSSRVISNKGGTMPYQEQPGKQWCKKWVDNEKHERCTIQGYNFDCKLCPYFEDIRKDRS